MYSNEAPYGLITGASTGLGKAFAEECARNGKNLLLVALPGEGLPEVCQSITSRFGVKTAWMEIDLTEENAVHEVSAWAQENYRVDLLINNAGIGGTKAFDQASFTYLDKILKLNVRATGLLTYLMLPELKTHQEAHILSVSSIIAFSAAAYKTFYPASKAFIHNFSRGLHEELKNTGVSVSVLMAGVMATNPSVVERMKHQGWMAQFILLQPEEAARKALHQMYLKKPVIVLGIGNKVSQLLAKYLPDKYRMSLLSRIVLRELNKDQEVKGSDPQKMVMPDPATKTRSF